jgi:hypothetical protein
MNPRRLLDVAKRLLTRSAEEDWRTATNRAYYAVLLVCRDALERWGFVAPKTDRVHQFVRDRFFQANNPDLVSIGRLLGTLSQKRSYADYDMTSPFFSTKAIATNAGTDADDALSRLDALEADLVKLAAAIAAIRSRFP